MIANPTTRFHLRVGDFPRESISLGGTVELNHDKKCWVATITANQFVTFTAAHEYQSAAIIAVLAQYLGFDATITRRPEE